MSATDSLTSAIVDLVPGRLAALVNAYPVDGRVSWHAPSVRGFAPMNCYLLEEDGRQMLCDTGLTIHREALLRQLHERLDPASAFSILLLRQGEFDSMCNLGPILAELDVEAIHGQYADAPEWADMHDEPAWRMSGRAGELPPTLVPASTDTIAVGAGGGRVLDIFVPELRLLGTYWAYDRDTRTLLTSDQFSYVVSTDPAGSWIVTERDDDITREQIAEHLVTTRYWWLPGADLDAARRDLARIFETFPVDRIAPGFGCILEGPSVVERHVAMVDQILADLGRSPSVAAA